MDILLKQVSLLNSLYIHLTQTNKKCSICNTPMANIYCLHKYRIW